MYPEEYAWVPTQREVAMLERYSSVWSEEDWEHRQCYQDFKTERWNAIQELVRTRLFLADSIYLICEVDAFLGERQYDRLPGSVRMTPTGLAEDPNAERRKEQKPARRDADIVQMLAAASARYRTEQAAKKADMEARYTAACAEIRQKNEKAARQAAAPLTMAEKLKGVTKKADATILPEPTRDEIWAQMELEPFLKKAEAASWYLPEGEKKWRAEKLMEDYKNPVCARRLAGTWRQWEVDFLNSYMHYRANITPY
jgi:hypothetical protein